MTTDKKIHGQPEPQLGYRLAFDGDTVCPGMRRWSHAREEWLATIVTEMDPGSFYAIPLDDGYTYYAPGETVIQAGDELDVHGQWMAYSPRAIGNRNGDPLRRPKAKPPSYACPKCEDTGTVMTQAGAGTYPFDCLDCKIAEGRNVKYLGFPHSLAPGRNINGLTCAQVETDQGWRLITEGELEKLPGDSERWVSGLPGWEFTGGGYGLLSRDYRTKTPLPVEKPEKVSVSFTVATDEAVKMKCYAVSPKLAEILTALLEAMQC